MIHNVVPVVLREHRHHHPPRTTDSNDTNTATNKEEAKATNQHHSFQTIFIKSGQTSHSWKNNIMTTTSSHEKHETDDEMKHQEEETTALEAPTPNDADATTPHALPDKKPSASSSSSSTRFLTTLKDVLLHHNVHLPTIHLTHAHAHNDKYDEQHLRNLIQHHKWEQVMKWLEEEERHQKAQLGADEFLIEHLSRSSNKSNNSSDEEDVNKEQNANHGGDDIKKKDNEGQTKSTIGSTTAVILPANDETAPTMEPPTEDKQEEELHDNALHMICRCHPPFCVIAKTLKLMPHLITQLNPQKETPLHVATSHGASPKVIHLLIKQYPQAVKMQDIRGRTPIHGHLYECCLPHKLNCDPGYLYEEREIHHHHDKKEADQHHNDKDEHVHGHHVTTQELVQGPLLQVIKELTKYMSSEDMGLQDKFGHIPLEIAKYYDCDVKTLAVIKEAM